MEGILQKLENRFKPCAIPCELWAESILSWATESQKYGCCAWAKRWLDITGALFGLIVLSPLLVLIGIAIKCTSKGPILYQQVRVGRFGRLFEIYKFRTMYEDAEKHTGPQWAKENDPRVTPLGRILRKIHLDELPQLINVLKGEMSFVGPRPERPEIVFSLQNKVKNYEKRLLVNPGITGWAQLRHRYDNSIDDVKKKVRYDLFYIRKMCLGVDVKLIVLTILGILFGTERGI